MIFWEYVNKKSREGSGISKLGTNIFGGLLIINMKLTHRVCFWGVFSKKRVEKVRFLGSDNINPMPESRI